LAAIRGYILIEVEAGNGRQVIEALRRLKGVESADLVTGPYDVIVIVEATDMNETADLIVDSVIGMPGVISTTTCLAIKAPD
jgi:DNA-binding Lrp family transcriptional regulator